MRCRSKPIEEMDRLVDNVDPRARLPRGFAFWSANHAAAAKSEEGRKENLVKSIPRKV